jgi:RIO kinase 1
MHLGEYEVAFRRNVDKRLDKQEKAHETDSLMKTKRSEQYDALEEVFDRSTLMVIYDFMNKGIINEIHGVVSAGKESRVYWGKDKQGKELAVKIYLTLSAEFRKGILRYIESDPRFKGTRRDTRSIIFAWAQKEFRNLQDAYAARVRVPKPLAVKRNVLVMEFIGEDGVNAPSMKDLRPSNPEKTYATLLTCLRKLYKKAKLVHGDLSEYNVMIWHGQLVIFDVSQAVSVSHPMAESMLRRDLENLSKYFNRLGVKVLPVEEAYRRISDDDRN